MDRHSSGLYAAHYERIGRAMDLLCCEAFTPRLTFASGVSVSFHLV